LSLKWGVMQIRVYTEEAWKSYPHMTCGCWGECHSPTWITQDQLIEVLERAALSGADSESYIIASEATIKAAREDNERRYNEARLKRVAPVEPQVIYTLK
jgi:hypothetical protein